VLASILVLTAALILWLQNRILSKGRYQIIAGKSFRHAEIDSAWPMIALMWLQTYRERLRRAWSGNVNGPASRRLLPLHFGPLYGV